MTLLANHDDAICDMFNQFGCDIFTFESGKPFLVMPEDGRLTATAS